MIDFSLLSKKHAGHLVGMFVLTLVCSVLIGNVMPPDNVLAQTPEIDPPLRQVWKAVFPAESAVRSAVADGDPVYLLTDEGIVHALSAADGQELWRTSGWLIPETARCPYDPPKLRSVTHAGFSPQNNVFLAVDGDWVVAALCAGWEYYITDQQLLLLDKTTGKLRGTWSVIGGRLVGVANGVMVIADQEGIYGASLEAQAEVWRVSGEEKYRIPYFEGMVDDVVLTRLDQNNQPMLTARSVESGSVLWEMPISSGAVFKFGEDRLLFVIQSKDDGDEAELLAVDSQTGKVVWKSDMIGFSGSIYWLEVTVQDATVYLYQNVAPGRIAALDVDTGATMWNVEMPLGIQRIRRLGDSVYCVRVGDMGEHTQLYALSGDNGQQVWSGLPGSDLLGGSSPRELLLVTSSSEGVRANDAVITAFRTR